MDYYIKLSDVLQTLKNEVHRQMEGAGAHTLHLVDMSLVADSIRKIKGINVIQCKDCQYAYDSIGGPCCSYGICVDCLTRDDFYCADGKEKVHCCDCRHFQVNVRPDGYLPEGVPEYECRYWCEPTDPANSCKHGERWES